MKPPITILKENWSIVKTQRTGYVSSMLETKTRERSGVLVSDFDQIRYNALVLFIFEHIE